MRDIEAITKSLIAQGLYDEVVKAQPTESDVHVNRPLTNISVATIQDARNFVAGKVFPGVPVTKQSDAYFTYDNAYWNTDEMQIRAPAAESEGSGYKVDGTPNYYCPIYALHRDIPDQVRSNSDAPLSLDREATMFLTLKALIKKEIVWVTNYFTGGVWTNWDYDGVSSSPGSNEVLQWNDASSTPIDDVWDAKAGILEATGFEPNKMVLGYQVYKTLVNHADIIARLNSGQTPGGPAKANAQRLAEIFEVDEVLVMKSIKNTSAEGATASHSFIGGKKAGLFYAPPSPGLMTPSAGYSFNYTGYLGAAADGQRMSRMRIDVRRCDRVEMEIAFDLKLVSAPLGAFWDSIVA